MMAQEDKFSSLEEASTEEVTQEQSGLHQRLLRRGAIVGLGVALVVLGLAGVRYRGQQTSAQVRNVEGKYLGGQLFFHGDPQLCTGNMNTLRPYLEGSTNRARYIASATGKTYNVVGYVQVYSSVQSSIYDKNGEAYTQLFWNLYNVDPRCSPANVEISPLTQTIRQPASCGIRIHEAMSCSVPAGEPYWNRAKVNDNVWLTSKYNSFPQFWDGIHGHNHPEPINTAQGGITIQTGLGVQELQNHVLIVYDYDGLMIACGPLVTTGGTNPWMPDMTLAPTPAPR